MKFISTRDTSISVTASQAILKGLSYEGGLFVPDTIPAVSGDTILELAKMPYEKRAFTILKLFLNDFTDEEIEYCTQNAYATGKFDAKTPAPLHALDSAAYFLELFHGPTCAFKDMALQILPYLLTTSAKKANMDKEVVILAATSGDTGKAALEGFKDVPGTRVMVIYPKEGVSPMQKMQMVTQEGGNVNVCGIDGNFDDAQTAVKAIFTNDEYNRMLARNGFVLSSANSINWGRLAPQIVYYFSAYCDLLNAGAIKNGEEINFVVPTGNFGNILAAYYAKKMGLPVKKLICASNRNKVLTDFIRTGIYDKNRAFMLTISPSMDILISSNLERLLFDLSDCDDRAIKGFMEALSKSGVYTVDDGMKETMQQLFYGGFADDTMTLSAIEKTYEQFGYLMDTHTAVAKSVYDAYLEKTGDTAKTVIVSTASPFKFNRSVAGAILGKQAIASLEESELLKILSEKTGLSLPKSLRGLWEKEVRFDAFVDKAQVKGAVSKFLQI